MKKFRNPIFAKILLLQIFFSMALGTQRAYAQFIVSDPIHNTTTTLQMVQDLVTQGLTLAQKIMDSDFYKYLKAVSEGVKTAQQVGRIINAEKNMLKSAEAALNTLKNSPHIKPQQLIGMVKMYKYFAEQSLANIKELNKLINPNIFQMSDGERIGVIDRLETKTVELEHHLNYYTAMNHELMRQQGEQLIEMQKLTDYYEKTKAATVSESSEVAYQKIGGFYGSIVDLLYSISAIVGLVGAVKIYGKFTSGDSDIWDTTKSWLGAVLLSVIITTFIKMIFF